MGEGMNMELTGIHHLTAVSANIRENYTFYTQVLGMRLVKRSVNQDDVSAYHLFYADGVGSPGTDLTFFDWNAPPERRGTNSIVRTYLRVNGAEALRWWADWLAEHDVQRSSISNHDDRLTLFFEDPEGQRLALIDDGGQGDKPIIWERSPIPAQYQIRGLGPIMLSVPKMEHTDLVLTKILNMRLVREYPHPENPGHTVSVFAMGAGGPHAELHVVVQPDLRAAFSGAGSVHHVALRAPDREHLLAWLSHLNRFGIRTSGEVDRFWFRSLYFREPNGILFEIATDGPGFGVDEDLATLGEKVVLPPFLEHRREAILANLKPID